MLQDEYQLDYFKENGFVRKQCQKCGPNFWTRDPEAELCGDAPCVEYSFIGNPVFKREYDISSMREAYLSFFERHGHTRVKRYPVIARWRDDIYLTIASIADFQPFVTSGIVPPPANPLTISQPCIRLDDLAGVKLVVAAGERAQKRGVNSGAIVLEMSKLVGGGGGGKPGIAQGGGMDVTRIEEALEKGVEMVKETVSFP